MTADTDIELDFGKPIPKALPGSYPAILVGIVPFKIKEGTPEAKTLIRWEFSLDGTDDPEQPGFTIILDGVTSTATGPRSKMRPWVSVLLGREFGDDDRLSLSALQAQAVGHPCIVAVEINEDGYSKVANVLPPLRQPARPTVPAPLLRAEPAAPVTNDRAAYEAAVAQPLTTLPNMADPNPIAVGLEDMTADARGRITTPDPTEPDDLPF